MSDGCKHLKMNVMKTKLFLLSLLLTSLNACHSPAMPKPGEPTLVITNPEIPALPLPWKVVKGSRITYLSVNLEGKRLIFH